MWSKWLVQNWKGVWQRICYRPAYLTKMGEHCKKCQARRITSWIFRTDLLRMEWFDLPVVQGTLKSLLQHHSSKVSILPCSAFFIVQLSHPYMPTGKTIALTRWTFVDKVMFVLFKMLSSWDITFLPKSKHLWISWLQSPFSVILGPPK